jgi:hypothetical protein
MYGMFLSNPRNLALPFRKKEYLNRKYDWLCLHSLRAAGFSVPVLKKGHLQKQGRLDESGKEKRSVVEKLGVYRTFGFV